MAKDKVLHDLLWRQSHVVVAVKVLWESSRSLSLHVSPQITHEQWSGGSNVTFLAK